MVDVFSTAKLMVSVTIISKVHFPKQSLEAFIYGLTIWST